VQKLAARTCGILAQLASYAGGSFVAALWQGV